jgi:hypothetical protein
MRTDYVYTPAGTDISIRWRAMGWVPPSESHEFQRKWKFYQELPMRKLDDHAKVEYEMLMRKAKVIRIK